jgi:hypothetical protein
LDFSTTDDEGFNAGTGRLAAEAVILEVLVFVDGLAEAELNKRKPFERWAKLGSSGILAVGLTGLDVFDRPGGA